MLHNSEMVTMGAIAFLFMVAVMVAVTVAGSLEALLAGLPL